MKTRSMHYLPMAALSVGLAAALPALAQNYVLKGFGYELPAAGANDNDSTQSMQRLIMKVNLLAGSTDQKGTLAIQQKLSSLSQATGTPMTLVRVMSGGAWLVEIPTPMLRAPIENLTNSIKAADPSVIYVHPDYPVRSHLTPNDPLYAQQWHYKAPTSSNRGTANLPGAWDQTRGAGVTVAVLDTGYTPHSDLNANLNPNGYDFVSQFDSDPTPGRDAEPLDTFGISTNGVCQPDCSWHGTHTAGTVAAIGNNGLGVTGVAYQAQVLPVRVLTSTHGDFADVVDAIWWTAGYTVPGLPGQSTPRAQVINMSLGSLFPFACPPSMSDAITAARSRGVVVVASAGNANSPADFPPGNCPGVINVGAALRDGKRAPYSNFGTTVAIMAPGGNDKLSPDGVVSTHNQGLTLPGAEGYVAMAGTSMAAPHVAGVAALIKSVRPTFSPDQVAQTIRDSARPFPSNSGCNTSTCGAGLLDATAAVQRALASSTDIPFNATLSGPWYNPPTSGQGLVIDVDSSINYIFAGWYTYAHDGGTGPNQLQKQRWLTIQSAYTPGDRIKTMPVYLNVGGNFDNVPTTGATQIGTATLSFQSCNTATLNYQITLDGQAKSGIMPLTRLTTSEYCQSGSIPPTSLALNGINSTLDGAWYEARTSGQGFQFHFAPLNNRAVFLAWYTYDINGQNSGTAGQRWFTIQGNYPAQSNQASNLIIYESTGGRFDVAPPSPTHNPVGTADLVIHSCTQASLTYNINGRPSRTIPLTRLAGAGGCVP